MSVLETIIRTSNPLGEERSILPISYTGSCTLSLCRLSGDPSLLVYNQTFLTNLLSFAGADLHISPVAYISYFISLYLIAPTLFFL